MTTLPSWAAGFRGRRVLVTGDTGCKGGWLCEWLLQLGAEVHGFGLPPTGPAPLFELLRLRTRLDHRDLDLLDRDGLRQLLRDLRPQLVFHLAAQPLVRRSYRQPLATFDTNVTGTANLLAAIDEAGGSPARPVAVVLVTSDKCYAPTDDGSPRAEDAPLGGHDPYSASKAMVELLAASWRSSFGGAGALRLATARAGNVLAGGDRAADRIAVDCVRALARGTTVPVRNPAAVRPWQHALDPLCGYLQLGARLCAAPAPRLGAVNFGPGRAGERTVAELVTAFVAAWGSGDWQPAPEPGAVAETAVLRLDAALARAELGWQPHWDFATAVQRTVEWYRADLASAHDATTMTALTQAQIAAYTAALRPVPAWPRHRPQPQPTGAGR